MGSHLVGWAFPANILPPPVHVQTNLSSKSAHKMSVSDSLTTMNRYRLYTKGRILGHKRAKRNTRPNTSLLQIEGVGSKEEAQFYLGKVVQLYIFSSIDSDFLRIISA